MKIINPRTLVGWAKQSVPTANVALARVPLRSAHLRVGTLRFAHPTQTLVNRETPILARVSGRFIHLAHPQNPHILVGWAKQRVATATLAPARRLLRRTHLRVGTLRFAHPTQTSVNRETLIAAGVSARFVCLDRTQNARTLVGWAKRSVPTATLAPAHMPIRRAHIRVGTLRFAYPTPSKPARSHFPFHLLSESV